MKIKSWIYIALFVCLITFGVCGSINTADAAANWRSEGPDGVNLGYWYNIKMAFNPATNQLYIAFDDASNGRKVTVKRFDGTNWVTVGTAGFSAGQIEDLSLVFNPDTNEPYVAYRDLGLTFQAMVKRFDGTNWVTVGSDISPDGIYDIDLAFNPTTYEPYVIYSDKLLGYRPTVKRYNGSAWVTVGTEGFGSGRVASMHLAFNPLTNEPYFAFHDMVNGQKVGVKKYNGSNWVSVGPATITSEASNDLSMIFNPLTNEPYVTYDDQTEYGEGMVMRFDGTNWVQVGDMDTDADYTDYAIGFHPDTHELYAAYRDDLYDMIVKKFNGTSWVQVGSTFPYRRFPQETIAFHPVSHDLYLASQDYVTRYTHIYTYDTNIVETPVASLTGGTYSSTQMITLSCATSGAATYYTLDGSIPTASSSVYSGPLTFSASRTLKAISMKSGMTDSNVLTVNYAIVGDIQTHSVIKTKNKRQAVTWQSSLPSVGTVYYGTKSRKLNKRKTDSVAATSHSLTLPKLTKGKRYYYKIVVQYPGTGQSSTTSVRSFKGRR